MSGKSDEVAKYFSLSDDGIAQLACHFGVETHEIERTMRKHGVHKSNVSMTHEDNRKQTRQATWILIGGVVITIIASLLIGSIFGGIWGAFTFVSAGVLAWATATTEPHWLGPLIALIPLAIVAWIVANLDNTPSKCVVRISAFKCITERDIPRGY